MRRSGNASLHHSPYRSLAPFLVYCYGVNQLCDLSCHNDFQFALLMHMHGVATVAAYHAVLY